jgi:hypothetical protein
MNLEDLIYLRYRVKEELDLAQATDDPRMVQVHYALACLYLDRTDNTDSDRRAPGRAGDQRR